MDTIEEGERVPRVEGVSVGGIGEPLSVKDVEPSGEKEVAVENEGKSVPRPLIDTTGQGEGVGEKLPQARVREGGGERVAYPVPEVLCPAESVGIGEKDPVERGVGVGKGGVKEGELSKDAVTTPELVGAPFVGDGQAVGVAAKGVGV